MKAALKGSLIGFCLAGVFLLGMAYLGRINSTPEPSKKEHVSITIRKNTLLVKSPYMRATAVFLQGNLMMTARHVCQDIREAYLVDYKSRAYRILKYHMSPNPFVDLCLLEVQTWDKLSVIPLPGTHIPTGYVSGVGSKVYIAGFGGGVFYSLRIGTIFSNEIISLEEHALYLVEDMVDVVIIPGNSGGGAFNADGQLVGIVSVGSSNSGGVVPTNQINQFLFSLKLPQQALINEQ